MNRMRAVTVRNGVFLGIVSMVFGLGEVRAGFNVSLDATTLNNTDTQFNYTASVAQGDQIVSGNNFTLLNFGGYVSGSITAPGGWSMSTTANATNPSATDLSFIYMGATPLVGPMPITGFSATSEFAGTQAGYFAANNESTTSGVATIHSVGGVLIPNSGLPSPAPAPEPSSLILGAIGAAGFGLSYLRRRRAGC